MTRAKGVCIDSSRECPYHALGWGSPFRCGRIMVSGSGDAATDPAGKIVPNHGRVIPAWCPLPDAPKAESVYVAEDVVEEGDQ